MDNLKRKWKMTKEIKEYFTHRRKKKINENDKVPFEGNKVIFFPVSPRKGWEIAAENP